jgi:hypothetical protein
MEQALEVGQHLYGLKVKRDDFNSLQEEIESAKVFAAKMQHFIEDQIQRAKTNQTVVASCALATFADSVNALSFFIKDNFTGATNGAYNRYYASDSSSTLARMVNNVQLEFSAYLIERQAYIDTFLDHIAQHGLHEQESWLDLKKSLESRAKQCSRLESSFMAQYPSQTCSNCLTRNPPLKTITESFVDTQRAKPPAPAAAKGLFSVFR